jgi:hypothetical protein
MMRMYTPRADIYKEEEINFIERHYMEQTDRWIGQQIGRSKDSVYSKRQVLGLMKYNTIPEHKFIPHNEEALNHEIEALVNFIETTTSEVWRDIANARRKYLLKTFKGQKYGREELGATAP